MQKKSFVKVLGISIAAAISSSVCLMPVSAANCSLQQIVFDYCNTSKTSCGNNNTSCGINILDYYNGASGMPSSVIETLQNELNKMLKDYTSQNNNNSSCFGSNNCNDNNNCNNDNSCNSSENKDNSKDCTGSDCKDTGKNQNTTDNTTPSGENTDKTDESIVPETPAVIEDDDFANYANEVLNLVNAERAKEGLSALTLDVKLCKAADVRAAEIVTSFSHTRPDGSSCFTAVKDAGYTSYKYLGENIAAGQKTPQAVVTAWMNSSGHRANIMSKNFTTLGVGYVKTSSGYGHYWSQMFAG